MFSHAYHKRSRKPLKCNKKFLVAFFPQGMYNTYQRMGATSHSNDTDASLNYSASFRVCQYTRVKFVYFFPYRMHAYTERGTPMIKFGQVQAYDAETGEATVTYVRPDACAKCGACGTLNQNGTIRLKADCAVGDWVRVELPDGRFMTATTLAYTVPLVGLLAGLFLGYFLSGAQELWALLGSLIGLGVCVLSLRLVEKRINGRPEWTPRITAVYHEKPEMDDIGCGGMA